jgi:hypothetical protein
MPPNFDTPMFKLWKIPIPNSCEIPSDFLKKVLLIFYISLSEQNLKKGVTIGLLWNLKCSHNGVKVSYKKAIILYFSNMKKKLFLGQHQNKNRI